MGTAEKDPVVVVVELGGGNDYLNTVIPYTDPNYYDNRKALRVEENEVLKLDSELGLNPNMGPMKDLYEAGDLAIIHGVGYENTSRSHFRSMDIWHTCEPVSVADDGWIGRAEREIDPKGENPVGIVSVGYGLPRALVADGVPVASVSDLASFACTQTHSIWSSVTPPLICSARCTAQRLEVALWARSCRISGRLVGTPSRAPTS